MTNLKAGWATALVVGFIWAAPAMALGLHIRWFSIDCGGGTVNGGGYTVTGSTGQPEGPAAMSGGGYSVSGGFWIPTTASPPACGCGDLNDNNVVDLGDFATFAGCFGLTAPDSNCTADVFACADLNGSGAIDLNDFSIFSGAFGLPPAGSPPDCQ